MQQVKKKKSKYHLATKNVSFRKLAVQFKKMGIKNNKFMLRLYDKRLLNIDPLSDNLTIKEQGIVIREIKRNPWYFLREIVKIAVPGGSKHYELHRGNCALTWCLINNISTIVELPRQHGKSISTIAFYLWIYLFGTENSEISFSNKLLSDSKLNLKRFKKMRELLPMYLQLYNKKDADNLTSIDSESRGNAITAKPSPISEEMADQLGRGCTEPCQWYDEFAFLKFNEIVYQSATPAQSQASEEAKANGRPYHILITTTPGDLMSGHGIFARKFFDGAKPFVEDLYDYDEEKLADYISKSRNQFLHIRFSYKQLGRSEEWFKLQCSKLDYNWEKINREVLIQWNKASGASPFSEDQIAILSNNKRDAIGTLVINGYLFNFYKRFDWIKTRVLIGVDVSSGMDQDSSAITISDANTLEVLADFNNSQIDTRDLSDLLLELTDIYLPNSVLFIERNSYGKGVIDNLLRTSASKKIYYEIKKVQAEKKITDVKKQKLNGNRTKVYGINTDKKTRPEMIELLRSIVQDDYEKLNSGKLIDDIVGLERNKKGKIEHSSVSHDDNLFSYLMIRWAWAFGTNLGHFYISTKNSLNSSSPDTMKRAFTSIMTVNKLSKQKLDPNSSMGMVNDFYNKQADEKIKKSTGKSKLFQEILRYN